MKRTLLLGSSLGALLLFGSLIFSVLNALAATVVVTTVSDVVADDGWCSLREAVIAANTDTASGSTAGECAAGSGADTIHFDPDLSPATFVLTMGGTGENAAATGDLDIVGALTIQGAGLTDTVLDGNGADRVLEVRPGAQVTVSGLSIRNGDAGADMGGGIKVLGALTMSDSTVESNQGGGIANDGGSLTLSNVEVVNNTGGYGLRNQSQASLTVTGGLVSGNQGGGVYNATSSASLSQLSIVNNTGGGGVHNTGAASLSHVTMTECQVMTNTATTGGGVFNEGTGVIMGIYNTRIRGNTATGAGGGVFNSGVMTLNGSTLDANQARSGGGIEHFGGTLSLVNATLSGNAASNNGGGLYNLSNATLSNVTLSGNTANGAGTGGNIFNDEAQLSIRNSIVAYSGADGNCFNSAGFVTSLGHNLDSGNTCGFSASGDIINSDPLLGGLADNGGPTWTRALMAGSPAIDKGNNATCPATDQRGAPRPVDGDGNGSAICDIGAFELGDVANLAIHKTSQPDPYLPGQAITYTILVTNAGLSTLSAITLTDQLPAAILNPGYTPSQGSFDSLDGAWTGLSLAAGQQVTLTITGTVEPGFNGTLQNTALVTPTNASDPVSDNNSSTNTNPSSPQADLSISKISQPTPHVPGQAITYTILVTNAGPSTLSAITLTDQLPAAILNPGYTPSQGSFNSLDGAWTGLSLAAGQQVTLTITGTVEPAFNGTLQNTALVTPTHASDPVSDNNSSTDTNPSSPQADLSIGATVSPGLVGPSQRMTYTLVISNLGPSVATSLLLTDTLPASVSFISVTAAGGGTCGYAGVVTCTLPSLAVGPSLTASIVVTAPASTGILTDTAWITASTFDPYHFNNEKVIPIQVSQLRRTYLPLILRSY